MVKVSVIVPARNREHTLERCLNSILSQTYEVDEIVICDDASTDNTKNLVDAYINKNRTPAIIFIRHPKPLGAQAARNSAIRKASGEIIAFIDSDDQWVEQKIEIQLELMTVHQAGVSHCGALRFEERENRYSLFGADLHRFSGDCHSRLLESGGVMFPGLVTTKEILEKIAYLDEKIPAFQEWDTAIRLSKICRFSYTPLPLFIYHVGNRDAISSSARKAALGYEMIINKHRGEILKYCPKSIFGHYTALVERFNKANMPEKANFYLSLLQAAHN